jgi:hypothetical protein
MSDIPTSNLIEVACPYCGDQFDVEAPAKDNNLQDPNKPFEVECVAYTRDIGRFDPKDETCWLSSSGWSRIGKDYFSLISYEKIGILRVDDPCINVRYRAQACPTCRNLFDVYANYTVKDEEPLLLDHLWPHVFARSRHSPNDIDLYKGESWPFWLTRQFSRLVGKSKTAGSILIGVLLFCFGLIPWLFQKPTNQWGLFLVETLLHFVAIISVCLVLIISNRYVKYLNSTTEFYETLAVREKRSVHHWLNYTRSRIMGVQGNHRYPKLTQVDVFAGGGGVLSLIFTWAVINHSWLIASLGIILLGALLLEFIDTRVILKGRISIEKTLKWIKPVLVIVVIMVIALVWLIVRPILSWSIINQGFDLIFWIFIAYLLGTGTLFTESIASYVLITLSRIPMHLSPYNQYKQIKPMRRIQAFSTWTILLLFLTIIFIAGIIITSRNIPNNDLGVSASFRQASIQWNWLVIWMSLALALIFGGLGVGKGKLNFLFLSVVYLVLYFLAGSWNPMIIVGPININFLNSPLTVQRIVMNLQGQLLVVGVFLTFLLIQHLVSTDKIITQIVEATRKKYLNIIDQQINSLNAYMQKLNDEFCKKLDKARIKELHKNTKTLNDLLELRIAVEQSRDRPKLRGLQLVSPIMTSLIFPTLLEGIIYPLLGP